VSLSRENPELIPFVALVTLCGKPTSLNCYRIRPN
jgi:hypothetical protein